MPFLHDPEPPASDLWCQRAGVCRHPYLQHAPGGGACLWWDPATDAHCGCRGFLYAAPPGSGPPDHPRYGGPPEVLPRLR